MIGLPDSTKATATRGTASRGTASAGIAWVGAATPAVPADTLRDENGVPYRDESGIPITSPP